MPLAVQAGLWGLLAGSALMLGAVIGWFASLPQRLVAGIMAFGAGVLISALSFELIDEAWVNGGLPATALGFLAGALIFTGANIVVSRLGARHRKRSGELRESEAGNPLMLAIGALLDGIPEALVIGISLIQGGAVSLVAVAAVFLSNVPEALSSSAGMRRTGWGIGATLGLWGAIALTSGVAAWTGYTAFAGADPPLIAFVQALAAGAILAMIIDTMVPEAADGSHELSGLIAVAGFLAAFTLSKLG